jgi:hypothetical protein
MVEDAEAREFADAPLSSPDNGEPNLEERITELSTQVAALTGLVEQAVGQLERRGEPTALTAEELADIAAQMVRLIDVRLESHSDRLEQVIALAGDGSPRLGVVDIDNATDLSLIDDHLALVGQAILEVQKAVVEMRDAPSAESRLEETGQLLAQKVEDQLASRVQRFEALSQAMIALAGEPIDALTEKLQQLARQREPTVEIARSLQQLERMVAALRDDALERDARMLQLLARLDELASPQPG